VFAATRPRLAIYNHVEEDARRVPKLGRCNYEAWVSQRSTELSDEKCRFANARPDPDLRYLSKRTASCSVGNSIDTTKDHGR
jgi:hypothetical protein